MTIVSGSVTGSSGYNSVFGFPTVGGNGWSVAGGSHWPTAMPADCGVGLLSIANFGGGGGSDFSYTTYVTSVTSSQNCIYYLSQSNEFVFDYIFSEYRDNLIFDSTSDTYWSSSKLDPVITPFILEIGDKISLYNTQTIGWDEKFEYTVKNTRYLQSSTNSPTGSRLIVEVNESVNGSLLSSGSGVPVDAATNSPFRSCRYVVWKHVPDETNVMLRYNPKDSTIIEEGLLFPQYISEEVKANSGNTIKALRAQNLLPPSP